MPSFTHDFIINIWILICFYLWFYMYLIHISSFSRLRCSQNIVKNLVSEWYLCLYHWKLVSYFLDCMQKYYFSANSKTLIYSHFTWHLVFIWSLDFGLSNEYLKSKSPFPVCKHSSDKLINSPFSKLLFGAFGRFLDSDSSWETGKKGKRG